MEQYRTSRFILANPHSFDISSNDNLVVTDNPAVQDDNGIEFGIISGNIKTDPDLPVLCRHWLPKWDNELQVEDITFDYHNKNEFYTLLYMVRLYNTCKYFNKNADNVKKIITKMFNSSIRANRDWELLCRFWDRVYAEFGYTM